MKTGDTYSAREMLDLTMATDKLDMYVLQIRAWTANVNYRFVNMCDLRANASRDRISMMQHQRRTRKETGDSCHERF